MDAINLYVLCQAIDLDNFGDYKDTLTKSGNRLAVKKEEIITLKSFLSELLSRKIQMSYLDNFIYGFSIPQISKEYDCILVDESQRLYEIDFNSVITAFKNFNRICIFAYDFYQVLSWKEEKLNIPDKLRSLDCFCEKHITEKIRTNKEIVSFIKHAIYLKNKPDDNIKYDCIDILYAIDYECATSIIEHYVYNKGYEFIAYTPSRVSSVLDYFKGYKNTHEVIGQEFDNVIFNMDDNFQYAEDGHLQGKMHPNPNYIFYKLWFQGVSRAREKLCILVIGNEELFKKLLSVKNKFK